MLTRILRMIRYRAVHRLRIRRAPAYPGMVEYLVELAPVIYPVALDGRWKVFWYYRHVVTVWLREARRESLKAWASSMLLCLPH